MDDTAGDEPLDDLPDVIESRRVPATVFRVTGVRHDGGGADHAGAAVYRLDVPVDVHVVQTVAHDEVLTFGGRRIQVAPQITAVAAGVVLPAGDRVPVSLGRMCRRLRRQGRVTVEAWGEVQPGFWWYCLIPWWRHHVDVDADRLGLVEGQELCAGAVVERAGGSWRWEQPVPLGDEAGAPVTVSRFTWYLVGVTDVPPPAKGRALRPTVAR